MKNFSIAKTISVFAGSITIMNFFFAIIPVAMNPSGWFQALSTGLKPEFKFIVFIIFTLLSSWGVNHFLVKIDQLDVNFSTKAYMVAILSSVLAWIVVFNIKVVAFSNSVEGLNLYLFPLFALAFHSFSAIMLHKDFEDLDYPISFVGDSEIWPFGTYFTPKYIFGTKVFFFWLIVLLGGYFYTI